MELENRYVVLKISDADKYLGPLAAQSVNKALEAIRRGRAEDGKPPSPHRLVLEEGWPEYEVAKNALEARIALDAMHDRKEFNRGASAAAQHYKEHKSSCHLKGISAFCNGWNNYMKTTGEV